MSTATTSVVTDDMIAAYRRDGFVKVPQIISAEEAASYRGEVMKVCEERQSRQLQDDAGRRPFQQIVNIWLENDKLKELTLHRGCQATGRQVAAAVA